MRNGLLAAAILICIAASARPQEPQSSTSASIPALAATQSDAVTVRPEAISDKVAPPGRQGEFSFYGNGNRLWCSAEFLLWWIKQGNAPALATSGTLDSLGALGPGTTTLFGGDLNYGERLGGRFTIGYWLDSSQTHGIEASYFFLGGPSDNFSASSADLPDSLLLARPFFNVITGLQDSQLVSYPGIISGTVGISSSSQLQGAEFNLVCNRCSCCNNCCPTDCCPTDCSLTDHFYKSGRHVDLIAGFRYLGLNEDLGITENLTTLATAPSPPFVPGEMITVADGFGTRNNFYGGQIGLRTEWRRGSWFVNVLGKVALGDTHQEVRINGTTDFTDPGVALVRQQGGMLALPTNIGNYSRDQFSVVPEIGFNVGRQMTDHLRVFVGYTLLYWSNVVRPGDQIDFGVNTTQLPTPTGPGTLVGEARPAFAFRNTDLWAQGINFGVEIRR
jgi:hypothetical protein